MPTRSDVIARIGALVAVAAILWTPPALALVSNTTKFTGTATGPGSVGRTITDISVPNAPGGVTGVQDTQGGTVNVTVSTGWSANRIGKEFRDAINANPALISSGYSASLSPADSSVVVTSRATGNFGVTDSNTVPGVTMTVIGWSVGDGPALSPWALVVLAAGLSALVWRRQRQTRA